MTKKIENSLGDLKLIRLVNDKFPPIDLNKCIPDIIALVDEIKNLRKQVKQLENEKEELINS